MYNIILYVTEVNKMTKNAITQGPGGGEENIEVLPLRWSAGIYQPVDGILSIGEYSSIDNFSSIEEYLSFQIFNQLLFVHMFFPTLGSIRILHQLRGHTYRLIFEKGN